MSKIAKIYSKYLRFSSISKMLCIFDDHHKSMIYEMLKNSFNLKWLKGIFDMKKVALILIILIAVISGCQKVSETKPLQAGEGLPVEYKSLSDIQVTACNAAHEAGTCDTRLAELGIVLKEDCCEVLGKCC